MKGSDNSQKWQGPMFAIPWRAYDDVVKHGAWALYATHSAAADVMLRTGLYGEPVMVLVTIEFPKKPVLPMEAKK